MVHGVVHGGMRDQKSVASAFIADEISILKDHENVQ
jgi:hypothetical protein